MDHSRSDLCLVQAKITLRLAKSNLNYCITASKANGFLFEVTYSRLETARLANTPGQSIPAV